MHKQMYEIGWHYGSQHELLYCSVTPFQVIRQGVLPGCSGESITGRYHTGRTFQSSPENFYPTEVAAWRSIINTITEEVQALDDHIQNLLLQVNSLRAYERLCNQRIESLLSEGSEGAGPKEDLAP